MDMNEDERVSKENVVASAAIRMTPFFLEEAIKRYRKQHPTHRMMTRIKIVLAVVMLPICVWMASRGYVPIAVLLMAVCVFSFFAHRVDLWRARRALTKSPYRDEVLTVAFSESGFHAKSPKQDSWSDWSLFTKAVHFPDGFLLLRGPKVFNWIPVSAIADSSQVSELENLLRVKIAEHKAFGSVRLVNEENEHRKPQGFETREES